MTLRDHTLLDTAIAAGAIAADTPALTLDLKTALCDSFKRETKELKNVGYKFRGKSALTDELLQQWLAEGNAGSLEDRGSASEDENSWWLPPGFVWGWLPSMRLGQFVTDTWAPGWWIPVEAILAKERLKSFEAAGPKTDPQGYHWVPFILESELTV